MKYINTDKVKAEIDKIIESLTNSYSPDPLYTIDEYRVAAVLEVLGLVKRVIDQMQQEGPLPPGIENESQKKGWLDYGLMMGEIGLHRYNAIHRIKEHKEQLVPLTIPDLYHVAEYYESVGTEKTCCYLQRYCMDFRFDQEELIKIIRV